MYPFREITPKRRPDRKECKHYRSYLETLREDFRKRCGYCDAPDSLRIRSYTIDHFIPRNPTDFTPNIKPNNYYNLVYSCLYCNSAKTNKWPTKNPDLPHNGKEGFIDPIEEDYTELYRRTATGQIVPTDKDNELAQHIIQELKLWLPVHERMWKLERISKLNDLIESKLEGLKDSDLKTELEQLHYEVLKFWKKIQDSVFVDNE